MDPASMPGTMVAERPEAPAKPFILHQNTPNPFNPRTEISFSLERPEPVRIEIYNTGGQLVRTLIDRTAGAGSHRVAWDGTDGYGRAVSAGQYFYLLRSGDFMEAKKMLFVK